MGGVLQKDGSVVLQNNWLGKTWLKLPEQVSKSSDCLKSYSELF